MGVSFPVGEWGFAPMPQKPISSLRRFSRILEVRFGQNSKLTLISYRFNLIKLLVNNVFHNSEKWGFENFLWGIFWGYFRFTPLGGPDPQFYFRLF